MNRKRARPVFKEYTVGQTVLLPTDLNELIPPDHIARVIYAFVQQLDTALLEACYKGGGTSSYHPKMMLAVLLLAYVQMTYSSRRIAKALRENIAFMWISGNQRPDFRTINNFRGEIVKEIILDIFTALLVMLVEEGYVKLEDYFVDGTKMEADANRYTFVWAKNTQRYQRQLEEKMVELFEHIDQINAAEEARYGERDLEELGGDGSLEAEKLQAHVHQLNTRLKGKAPASAEPVPVPLSQQPPTPEDEAERTQSADGQLPLPLQEDPTGEPPVPSPVSDAPTTQPAAPLLSERLVHKLQEVQQALAEDPENKALAQAARRMQEDYLPRALKYEEQVRLLAGRNSYSKTDPEATFMRMKDDHLGNGQLRPAYNIQTGTENQFVVNFSLHQEAGDPTCLIPHLEQLKAKLRRLPDKITGDAAYGSEENYAYLDGENVGNYLKYNRFDREQKKRYKPDPFRAENMTYDEVADEFVCPQGKRMVYRHAQHARTKNGYQGEQRVYECKSCQGCPVKEQCTRAAGNRQIRVSFQLRAYRQQARENLLSEEGVRLRAQRGMDVETVFGRIKEDWKFRRFLLRGLEKVRTEWGLLCMAHNLAKVWNAQNGEMLTTL